MYGAGADVDDEPVSLTHGPACHLLVRPIITECSIHIQ